MSQEPYNLPALPANKRIKRLSFLIFASKALRNISNGSLSTLLLYFYFRNVFYQAPQNISLSWAAITITSFLKSAFVSRQAHKIGPVNVLLIGYLLQLITLIIINLRDLYAYGTHLIYTLVFAIGFVSPLGDEIGPFEDIQLTFLNKQHPDIFFRTKKKYDRIGYMSLALGSLTILYLYFSLEETFYENYRIHQILAFIFCINVVSYLISLIIRRQTEREKSFIQKVEKKTEAPLSIRIQVHYLVEGFFLGLISAPFIVYYSEAKLNFYYHKVGFLIASFFLLKGLGRQFFQKFQSFRSLFKFCFALTNTFLIFAAISRMNLLILVSLILAFPFWHYGQIELEKVMHHEKKGRLIQSGLWKGAGAAIGLAVSSYFFSFLHFGPQINFVFILFGIAKQANVMFIFKFCSQQNEKGFYIQSEGNSTLFANSDEEFSACCGNLCDTNNTDNPQKETAKNEPLFQKAVKILFALLLIVFVLLFFTFSLNHQLYKLKYKGDDFRPSADLKLYNQSLAQYLLKQNITKVKLLNCHNKCQEQYKVKGKGYSWLQYQNLEPEWLHYVQASYFADQSEIFQEIADISDLKLKGFSLFWNNLLYYHKIQKNIHRSIFSYAEKHGFFYQEMPSLNLRAVENKIVLIFTREKRVPVELPAFVRQSPPKNYLAFETTFKMVTNIPHLREFIIYHLRAGVDKFFLYDNDQPTDSPNFFFDHRIGNFLQQCLSYNISAEYSLFQDIWEEFYDHIVYIPWRISKGHPHAEARENYFLYFKQVTRYTSFTDLDQYLFSPSGQYIPTMISRLQDKYDIGMIVIMSRQFLHRFCLQNGRLGLEQYKWTPRDRVNITKKVIIMNDLIIREGLHGRSIKSGDYTVEYDQRHDLRFNHYKMTTNRYDSIEFKRAFTDDAMRGLVKDIKDACKGKCSDSLKSSCSPTIELKEQCQMVEGDQ